MPATIEFHTQWRKSRFSGPDANCVEVAFGAGVRDSKNLAGGHLTLHTGAYRGLVTFARHVSRIG